MRLLPQLLRKDVPLEQTWDLSSLFSSEDAWQQALKELHKDVEKVTYYQGKLAESASTLYKAIQKYEAFYEKLIHVRTYAFLRTSADGRNEQYQADLAKAASTLADVSARLAFFEPELLSIPTEKLEQFLQEEKKLNTYQKMFYDVIEKKQHTLSIEVEQVLAQLSEVLDAPQLIYERSKQTDMTFPPLSNEAGEELPLSEALYEDRYEISPNTKLRRQAYERYVSTLENYKNTTAALYATEVTKQVQLAKLRNYDSVTEMLLQPQDVSVEMYENQLQVIQTELAPVMRKLARLKERQLQLDRITYADLKAPLDPDFEPKTSFAKAKDLILQALQVLGPEYVKIMERAFDEAWIDYANNVGKQSGAFCASPYGANSFILMTWTDQMRGSFTLAHELGHAGHFQLANKNQSLLNTQVSTYFVEAPSTLNELLLAAYLFEQSKDDRMRAYVINNLLDTYYHNFVTHMLEAAFQYRVYDLAEAGLPLTAELLTKVKYEAIKNFWGEDVEIPRSAGLIWMRQPHYYMGLYPYTYSAGLTIATSVAQKIKKGEPKIVDRWLEVLKAGSSLKPIDLAKKLNIDMTKKTTIQEAVKYVASLVDELENIYQ